MSVDNLESAKENRLLWPPISDAVDTYLRRKTAGAEGYELTWRLVHVWESIATTLAAASATRLRDMPDLAPLYRRAREQYHGRFWDPIARGFKRAPSAFDGSATRRLDVISSLASADVDGSLFLASLKSFMLSPSIDLSPLVETWTRVCDVPSATRQSAPLEVREAMRHVNTFRNRFAHVPFPYDLMDALAGALENVTEQMFSIPPQPHCLLTNDATPESPLCGAVLWKDRAMRGGDNFRLRTPARDTCDFCYPPVPKRGQQQEIWSSTPFICVDAMVRPYVMTRLTPESDGTWEFTRFRAETSSVFTKEDSSWLAALPQPTQAEYETPQDVADRAEAIAMAPAAVSQVDGPMSPASTALVEPASFDEALRFVRNEEFEPAIRYFKRYVEARPDYHIGWLRLGHAQRELAMRRRVTNPEDALKLLDEALDSLGRAGGHVDPSRRGQAFYEKSKANYHRGRIGMDVKYIAQASEDAKQASELAADPAYESWRDYILRHQELPRSTPHSSTPRSMSGGL